MSSKIPTGLPACRPALQGALGAPRPPAKSTAYALDPLFALVFGRAFREEHRRVYLKRFRCSSRTLCNTPDAVGKVCSRKGQKT